MALPALGVGVGLLEEHEARAAEHQAVGRDRPSAWMFAPVVIVIVVSA